MDLTNQNQHTMISHSVHYYSKLFVFLLKCCAFRFLLFLSKNVLLLDLILQVKLPVWKCSTKYSLLKDTLNQSLHLGSFLKSTMWICFLEPAT